MRFVSWNVNGLRACLKKGFIKSLTTFDPDIIALQEIKTSIPIPEAIPPGYSADWYFSERSGYSGVLCLFKSKPLSIRHGFGEAEFDGEGRLITLEYNNFFFLNVYVPNSQGGLHRSCFRHDWDQHFINYIESLHTEKPVVIGGDFNVAHKYLDVFPENCRNETEPAGFLMSERDGFYSLLDVGLIDIFRKLNPELEGAYTWWSNRLHKRNENRGWRLDYFLISEQLRSKVKNCAILTDVLGSDHAPISLTISL